MSKVVEGNRVKIYSEKGELIQEREITLEDLKEILQQYIDSKLQELVQQHEIEVTLDITTGKGIGRFKKKPPTPPEPPTRTA